MKQTFFDWHLTKNAPVICRRSRQPRYLKYENPVSDFHEALHLNIQFAGEGQKKIGADLVELKGIACSLTASWEPHKTAFSPDGALLLMTAIHPGALFESLPGSEEKLQKIIALPPVQRHELIAKYVPENFLMKIVTDLYSEETIHTLVQNFQNREKTKKKLDSCGTICPIWERWHIILRFFVKLLSCDLPEVLPEKVSYSYSDLIPAFRFMAENPCRRIEAQECAEICCMGVSSFRKNFREVTGSTFAEYELACRFRQAVSELFEGTLVIKELAEKYGFYDISHFIRLFKKKYGDSPLHFTQNMKKNNKRDDEENERKTGRN